MKELGSVRLDKWLLAAEAIKGGHVEVNGTRAKPARTTRVGDEVEVRKGPFVYRISVLELRERRVSAKEAQTLYSESDASIEARAALRLQLKSQAQQILYDPRKPSPRDRRSARDRKRRFE